MNARKGWITSLGMLLMLVVGCRSTQPDLKPPKQPEVFNAPSESANLSSYPKQAFNNNDDVSKRALDAMAQRGQGNGMQPANFGGPSSMTGAPGSFGNGSR